MTRAPDGPVASEHPARLLGVAAWFALVGALGEIAIKAVQELVLGTFTGHAGWNVIWMTPLAYLVFYALLATALLLLRPLVPRLGSLGAFGAIFTAVTALALLMYLDRHVHPLALLLLALGLAAVLGRVIAAAPLRFARVVSRSGAVLAGIVILVSAGPLVSLEWAERRGLASLPDAPRDAPNVLLLLLDTVRAANLELHGYDRATMPNLARLAERGVVFDWAFATAPWTLPSHASMFTGRYPFELSSRLDEPLDERHRTLAEVLRAHGYATTAFVANTFAAQRSTGLAQGFLHYEDFGVTAGQFAASSSLVRAPLRSRLLRRLVRYHGLLGRRSADRINHDFLAWQRGNGGRPFFAFLNYFDAHAPYRAPPPFDRRFGSDSAASPLLIQERYRDVVIAEDRARILAERNAYDEALAYLDDAIARLLGELERRGVLRNTVVVITSDHGEELGEHGKLGHAHALHTTQLHVPLVILAPGRVPAGTRVPAPVSLRDLPATILGLAAVADERPLAGSSLARYWASRGGDSGSDTLFAARDGAVSVITGEYQYIRTDDGREQLYAYRNDPLELRDLVDRESARDALNALRAAASEASASTPPEGHGP